MNATSSRAPALTRSYTAGSSPNTPTSPTSPTSQGSPQSASTSRWPTRGGMSRKDSSNSATSTMSSSSSSSSGNVNQYTHCGRHTDQYLFSGWSKVFNTKH